MMGNREFTSGEDFHAKIDRIPINNWRGKATAETYKDAATMLVERGFGQDEALKLLFKLYYVDADVTTLLIRRCGFSQNEALKLLFESCFYAAADEFGEKWETENSETI